MRAICILAILASAPLIPRDGAAQEFRIYTRVLVMNEAVPEKVAGDAGRNDVIARSLTLFHAGRVYDYIETIGEVIVLEPAHRRFTVLNLSREVATTVELDELTNLLKVARNETDNYVSRLENEDNAASKAAAEMLRFQSAPQFDEHYDESKRVLSLSSRLIKYQAECSTDAASEIIDAWTKYADCMARLNFVLHPGAVLPDSRLALNTSLSQRRLLPTSVELVIDAQPRVHLRAEHQIHWELDARDRSLLHHWESVLKRKSTKSVTLHEYQRLATSNGPNRRKPTTMATREPASEN